MFTTYALNPLATTVRTQEILDHRSVAALCRKKGYFEEATIARYTDFLEEIEEGESFPATPEVLKHVACYILRYSDIDTLMNESGQTEIEMVASVMWELSTECVKRFYHVEMKGGNK